MLSRPFGRGGRGGGGHHYHNAQSGGGGSDTVQILVSNVKYPVTEDTMRRVFAGIAQPLRVTLSPQPTGDVSCIVQFSKPEEAERAIAERNGRFIYSDCNKMTIAFAAPQWNAGGNDVYGGAPSGVLQPPMSAVPFNPAAQMPNPYAAGNPYAADPSAAYAQQAAAFNQMMMPNPMQAMAGAFAAPGFNPMQMGVMGGGGRGMGGMGRGRGGGMVGQGPNPMQMGMPNMGMMQMGMGMPNAQQQQVNNNLPTVFLSVAQLAEDVPLQHLFTLMEAFGGVVAIRRNHSRPTIATVKMASIAEADLVIQYMRHVPLGATNTVSAKRFPTYTERNPCTEEGNPLVATTLQYDFTTSRHRSPQQRSRSVPTKMLRITNCAASTEADLMQFFTEKNFFPERVTRDGDAFLVRMDSIANAVKLLIECQGNVCNEQKSNVIFVEDPQAAAEAAAAAAAGGAAPAEGQAVVQHAE